MWCGRCRETPLQDAYSQTQAEKLIKPTNHKAVGVQAAAPGTRRESNGLGDGEASVKHWMKVLGAALKNKNPPPVEIAAHEGKPAARIEFSIAEYDEPASASA
jgi:hypothetical protein